MKASGKQDAQVTNKQGKNPVAVILQIKEQNIWVDAINRENLNLKIYDNFLVNPKKLTVISDKPTQNFLITLKEENPSQTLKNSNNTDEECNLINAVNHTVKEQLKSMSYIPQQRYHQPATSNQEIGWYTDIEIKQKQKQDQFSYERKMCKETKYADVYFTAQKVSPYSNKFK